MIIYLCRAYEPFILTKNENDALFKIYVPFNGDPTRTLTYCGGFTAVYSLNHPYQAIVE